MPLQIPEATILEPSDTIVAVKSEKELMIMRVNKFNSGEDASFSDFLFLLHA